MNHHEMANRHEPGAKDQGAALTEHVIGKPASKEWSQVNKPGIETINLRCEGLRAEWSKHAFEHNGALRRARRWRGGNAARAAFVRGAARGRL
jgi:hypothetical protein